ncbi:MAG: tetratricopeptide repeat protein [Bacteroidia bacterium]|nr:tetratricopeptide repeat protein [Bacteroidia bacterium]
MSNLQNLKVYPLHFFYQQLDRKDKFLFGILFACIVFLAVSLLWVGSDPMGMAISVTEVSDQSRENIPLAELHAHYRDLGFSIPAYKEAVSFTAGLIHAKTFLVPLFLLFQVIGWSFLLAASTRIRNWVCYPIYLVFGMHLYFSGYGALLSPGAEMITNGVIIIVFLALAFLFQQEIVRVNLFVRTLIFLVLYGGLNVAMYFLTSWVGLHQLAISGFPILLLVVFFFLFFIGNDLTNLLIFAATNHKEPKKRLGLGIISAIYLGLLAIEFILFQEHGDLGLFKLNIGLRPLHLLALISVFTVATQQNIYPKVRDQFQGNSGFTMLVASLVVVALSSIVFFISQGEILYLRMIERHTIIFLFITGVFHFLYLLINFNKLLEDRVNIYFLTRMPKRLMYFFVVITTLLAAYGMEAKDNRKSYKIAMAAFHNLEGDHTLIQSEMAAAQMVTDFDNFEVHKGVSEDYREQSRQNYQDALYYASGSVKANYNLGCLLVGEKGTEQRVSDLFHNAGKLIDFPHAALNQGNLVAAVGDRKFAKKVFRDYLKKRDSNPWIANNLGMIFRKAGLPDSAIVYLREALLEAPNEGTLYGNLALVYVENDRPQNAKDFFEAGLKLHKISPSLVTNSLFFGTLTRDSVAMPDDLFSRPELAGRESVAFNRALYLYNNGKMSQVQAVLDEIMAPGGVQSKEVSNEVLFLDGVLKYDRGDLVNGISRMEFLAGTDPRFAATAYHFMALQYFKNGCPEMAAEYFRKAAEKGLEDDHFWAGVMEIDAGNHEYAQNQLNLIRVLYPHQWDAVSREMGMLLRAYGHSDLAYTEWDFEDMTFNEAMRIALYSDQAGNTLGLLDNFLTATQLDSTSVLPYLELGRINLKNHNPMAMANLTAGLQIDRGNLPLWVEIGEAKLQAGDLAGAKHLADSLFEAHPDDRGARLLLARTGLAQGDTASAVQELDSLVKDHPLDVEIYQTLGDVLRKQGAAVDGYGIFYLATQLNSRNAVLWYYLAAFARQLGPLGVQDCGSAAVRAIEFSYSSKEKLRIAGEFARELQALSQK